MTRTKWFCGAIVAVATAVCAGAVCGEDTGAVQAGRKSGKGGLKEEIRGYLEQQRAENRAFRSSLEGMTNFDQKISEIIDHREKQYQENKAFWAQEHQKLMAAITEKMVGKSRLTDTRRKEVTDFLEKQYQENVAFMDTLHGEVIAMLKGMESGTAPAKGEMRRKISEFRKQEREKILKHRQEQEADRKAFREKMAGELKAGGAPAKEAAATQTQ